jgi:hypothetical protein
MRIPNSDKERRDLIKRLARKGELVVKRGSGKVSEVFWKLPRPKDPEGPLLKALLEDREEDR